MVVQSWVETLIGDEHSQNSHRSCLQGDARIGSVLGVLRPVKHLGAFLATALQGGSIP